ncbi:MAG: serine protease [Dysgonamonadaceae bacterium]|jgi:hypothetical protein|nr:serine protease [Dysgonamonadaceae bacterium]
MEWLNELDPLLKVYWIIAGIASLIFLIQMLMTFVGMDGSDGLDAGGMDGGDMPNDGPFPFFSLRNLVNFFLGFGWGGVCFYHTFSSQIGIAACALLTGIAFVLLFFFLIRQFMKLNQDNTFKISDTLHHSADVYLFIPGEKSGKGKIQISIKGSVHEIDAMTSGEKIPTGTKAYVTAIIDNQTVLVTKI